MKCMLAIACFFVRSVCFSTPVSPNLTAVYDQQKAVVKLKWQNNDLRSKGFVLQRSADGNKWIDIYNLTVDDFSISRMEKFSDEHPAPDKNYYRLKIMLDKNEAEFSPSILVVMGGSSKSWIIYPVPVTSVLNLQYTGSDLITGVITVFIENLQGEILIKSRSSSLNRMIQIPVSNLGKGIYNVRIMIENEIVWNQRFLK